MANVKVDMIAGPLLTHEARPWNRWMKAAGELAHEFGDFDDDPFAYNETATVSFLTSAAGRADMIAIAEFLTVKRHREDRRLNVPGRCDFWLSSRRRTRAFEFKQVCAGR